MVRRSRHVHVNRHQAGQFGGGRDRCLAGTREELVPMVATRSVVLVVVLMVTVAGHGRGRWCRYRRVGRQSSCS